MLIASSPSSKSERGASRIGFAFRVSCSWEVAVRVELVRFGVYGVIMEDLPTHDVKTFPRNTQNSGTYQMLARTVVPLGMYPPWYSSSSIVACGTPRRRFSVPGALSANV